MSDLLRPNPRNLLAPDISGPNPGRALAEALLGGQRRVDAAVTSGLWEHHDVPEFPTGKYVLRRDPETRMMCKVWLSTEQLEAERAAEVAEALAVEPSVTEPSVVSRADDEWLSMATARVEVAKPYSYTKGKLATELALEGHLDKARWTVLIRRLVKAGTLNETQPGHHGHRTRRLEVGTGNISRARTRRTRDTRTQVRGSVPSQPPSSLPAGPTNGKAENSGVIAW